MLLGMRYLSGLLLLFLCGCSATWVAPLDFVNVNIQTEKYEIATWQRTTNLSDPIHIYIEGDGRAFDGRGQPTRNPTPRGHLVRNFVSNDPAANVAYIARPCQYVMSETCSVSDWTSGRFSVDIIESTAHAIKKIAKDRPVILIGYSGGALLSGLIIQKYPEINIKKWITIAGVLNHSDWTKHFGDEPLSTSQDLNTLPNISQTHYVAEHDKTVPYELSSRWTGGKNLVVVPGATHDDFGDWNPEL